MRWFFTLLLLIASCTWYAEQERIEQCRVAQCGKVCSQASTSDKSDPDRDWYCQKCIARCHHPEAWPDPMGRPGGAR